MKIKKDFFDQRSTVVVISLTILFFHQLIFQKLFPTSRGLLGHDFQQVTNYFIFGKFWFDKNFLSIPWFTPTICCGLPFFPDPQSMFYSIPQFIFIVFDDPILSIKLTFLFYSLIAYLGMFFLTKKVFNFNVFTAIFCSTLFLFNGFFVSRFLSGHVSYVSYVFVPLYCFFLFQSFDKKKLHEKTFNIIISSIILANFFHSGSGPIMHIILASIFSIIVIYSFYKKNLKIFYNFGISFLFGILIAFSKISSALILLKNLPRVYPQSEYISIFHFLKSTFASIFFKPDLEFHNSNISAMFKFGLHEIDFSLGFFAIIPFAFLIFIKKQHLISFYKRKIDMILLILIFVIPILMNVNLFNQYELIKKLPLLKSQWVQYRWLLIYIVPIILFSGFLLMIKNPFQKYIRFLPFVLTIFLLFQNYTKDRSWYIEDSKYSIKNIEKLFLKNQKLRITGPGVILNKETKKPPSSYNKNDLFVYNLSQLACYNPILGYGLEHLPKNKIFFSKQKDLPNNNMLLYADALEHKGDKLNFFNPACYLFPEENNCSKGDLFDVSEKENLIKFLNYEKLSFRQSNLQILSNYISFYTFLIFISYVIIYILINLIRRK